MGARTGWFICEDCGQEVFRRMRSDRELVCLACGIKRSAQNAAKLHAARESRQQVRRRQAVAPKSAAE